MINIIIYNYLFSLLFRYVLILVLLKLNKNKQNFDCFSIKLYEKINKFKVSLKLIHFIRSKSSFCAKETENRAEGRLETDAEERCPCAVPFVGHFARP